MARDIGLHHACMREQLSKCNGYEVATEGDSFKCAFHTPEDAILWCVRVQTALMAQPWSAELEDGGASVLAAGDTWANIQNATVAAQYTALLDKLAGQSAEADAKPAASKRLPSLVPEQHVLEAAATEFSFNWRHSMVGVSRPCCLLSTFLPTHTRTLVYPDYFCSSFAACCCKLYVRLDVPEAYLLVSRYAYKCRRADISLQK